MTCFLPQETFLYSSPYWSDYEEFNPAGGKTGFDERESKLPTIPSGTLHSPRSVSVWRSTNSSGSLSSTKRVTLCTHWLLTENSVPLLWVMKHWSRWLVQGPLCNSTATRKGLMQAVALPNIPNPESVLLETLRTNPTHATQGLDLVRKVDLMTQTLATLKTWHDSNNLPSFYT